MSGYNHSEVWLANTPMEEFVPSTCQAAGIIKLAKSRNNPIYTVGQVCLALPLHVDNFVIDSRYRRKGNMVRVICLKYGGRTMCRESFRSSPFSQFALPRIRHQRRTSGIRSHHIYRLDRVPTTEIGNFCGHTMNTEIRTPQWQSNTFLPRNNYPRQQGNLGFDCREDDTMTFGSGLT